MTLLETVGAASRPHVTGPVPGPRSRALLARQSRRESSAHVYPGHIPIAVEDAAGSFRDPLSGRPADDLAARVQAEALANGLIVELGGRDDCVVRLLPPLNVSPGRRRSESRKPSSTPTSRCWAPGSWSATTACAATRARVRLAGPVWRRWDG